MRIKYRRVRGEHVVEVRLDTDGELLAFVNMINAASEGCVAGVHPRGDIRRALASALSTSTFLALHPDVREAVKRADAEEVPDAH